jgi:TRAP-type C4-dicarboxylate transport system permease large subunit
MESEFSSNFKRAAPIEKLLAFHITAAYMFGWFLHLAQVSTMLMRLDKDTHVHTNTQTLEAVTPWNSCSVRR